MLNNDNNERYAKYDFKKLNFMWGKNSKRKKNVNNIVGQLFINIDSEKTKPT